ncbi:hypothetical protein FA13DRAFT_1042625 [Coprinellus micaceus]|uniref:Uncharacterized protein n=1 Tax=Coprinellus micaceus TaxID=71717 RepID=A0A4Y7SXD1_COPMI|nr:hypothetical protein FA13DRAFT_1042625 [Coprinellus micaceus]
MSVQWRGSSTRQSGCVVVVEEEKGMGVWCSWLCSASLFSFSIAFRQLTRLPRKLGKPIESASTSCLSIQRSLPHSLTNAPLALIVDPLGVAGPFSPAPLCDVFCLDVTRILQKVTRKDPPECLLASPSSASPTVVYGYVKPMAPEVSTSDLPYSIEGPLAAYQVKNLSQPQFEVRERGFAATLEDVRYSVAPSPRAPPLAFMTPTRHGLWLDIAPRDGHRRPHPQRRSDASKTRPSNENTVGRRGIDGSTWTHGICTTQT